MSPDNTRSVREGLVVGAIAYAAVALFYAMFDALAARGGLFTVNLLGLALFRGQRDPAILQLPIGLDWAALLGYNAVHLAISLAIGVTVVGLASHAERHPARASAVTAIIVAGFAVTVVAVGLLTTAIRPLLPWWSIVVANSFAVLVAGRYLLRKHPELWGKLMPTDG